MRIAIVGAGLGGMSAAIRLAGAGHEVDVFEKDAQEGGKAGSLARDGFRFDTGPTLLTLPSVFNEIVDSLSFVPIDPLCTYYYDDGTVINAFRDPKSFAEEIGRKTSDPPKKLLAYLSRARATYEAAAPLFLSRNLHEPATWLDPGTLSLVPRLPALDPGRTLHQAHASSFGDQRLVQLFDRFATYNGSDPYQAPAALALISHVEHGVGGYAVKGGVREIPRAFRLRAESAGARFHCGCTVDRILVESGHAVGVETDARRIGADVVISNVDVLTTRRHLLGQPSAAATRRLERRDPSTSGLLFLWGVRGSFPQLGVNTILFPPRYEEEFRDLFRGHICPGDPTVYIHVSSRVTPSDAPAGCENWYVLVNAPADRGQDWAAATAETRARVLSRIRRALGRDVEPLIAFEEVLAPPDFASRTGSAGGSLYGSASNSRFSAFLRQRNRSLRPRGLYYCGGSAHPGGGMPLVTLSGKIVADLVEKHEARGR